MEEELDCKLLTFLQKNFVNTVTRTQLSPTLVPGPSGQSVLLGSGCLVAKKGFRTRIFDDGYP